MYKKKDLSDELVKIIMKVSKAYIYGNQWIIPEISNIDYKTSDFDVKAIIKRNTEGVGLPKLNLPSPVFYGTSFINKNVEDPIKQSSNSPSSLPVTSLEIKNEYDSIKKGLQPNSKVQAPYEHEKVEFNENKIHPLKHIKRAKGPERKAPSDAVKFLEQRNNMQCETVQCSKSKDFELSQDNSKITYLKANAAATLKPQDNNDDQSLLSSNLINQIESQSGKKSGIEKSQDNLSQRNHSSNVVHNSAKDHSQAKTVQPVTAEGFVALRNQFCDKVEKNENNIGATKFMSPGTRISILSHAPNSSDIYHAATPENEKSVAPTKKKPAGARQSILGLVAPDFPTKNLNTISTTGVDVISPLKSKFTASMHKLADLPPPSPPSLDKKPMKIFGTSNKPEINIPNDAILIESEKKDKMPIKPPLPVKRKNNTNSNGNADICLTNSTSSDQNKLAPPTKQVNKNLDDLEGRAPATPQIHLSEKEQNSKKTYGGIISFPSSPNPESKHHILPEPLKENVETVSKLNDNGTQISSKPSMLPPRHNFDGIANNTEELEISDHKAPILKKEEVKDQSASKNQTGFFLPQPNLKGVAKNKDEIENTNNKTHLFKKDDCDELAKNQSILFKNSGPSSVETISMEKSKNDQQDVSKKGSPPVNKVPLKKSGITTPISEKVKGNHSKDLSPEKIQPVTNEEQYFIPNKPVPIKKGVLTPYSTASEKNDESTNLKNSNKSSALPSPNFTEEPLNKGPVIPSRPGEYLAQQTTATSPQQRNPPSSVVTNRKSMILEMSQKLGSIPMQKPKGYLSARPQSYLSSGFIKVSDAVQDANASNISTSETEKLKSEVSTLSWKKEFEARKSKMSNN